MYSSTENGLLIDKEMDETSHLGRVDVKNNDF